MKLYKGQLVVDIMTVVNMNSEEKMTEEAHEGITFELFDEITTLIGAKGYLTPSIGATLESNGEASVGQIQAITRNEIGAMRAAESLYNKANRIRIQISNK